jgi:hypothetical protein
MSGDYSRFTDRPKRRYSGVLMQQGRVQLDADWNEQADIVRRRWETQARDTFGASGVPRATTPDGFKISTLAGGDLAIAAGRIYVDGKLAELFTGEQVGMPPGTVYSVSYLHQPFYPDPQALPAVANIFLDVWDREVTYVEDPDILEKALGGPDTATRRQTVWQVKVLAVAPADGKDSAICGVPLPLPSGGLLSTQAVAPPPSDDPCDLAPSGGYRGLENRLYRVEVHTGGDLATASFKWSRDNASVVSTVTGITSNATASQLVVTRIGRDAVLRFAQDDWVEVTDDFRELMGEPGEMAKIAGVDEASRTITLDRKIPTGTGRAFGATAQELAGRHTRMRLWNQTLGVDANGLLAQTGSSWISLEDGVEIQLSGADLRTGDYWVFAARAVDGSVETLDHAEPRGIRHHYSQLAAIDASGVHDCRHLWPEAGAACCCCTVEVGDGTQSHGDFDDLQIAYAQLSQLSSNLSVVPLVICLLPGNHVLRQTFTIGRDCVTIRGCGRSSAVTAQLAAPAFNFAADFGTLEGIYLTFEGDAATVPAILCGGRGNRIVDNEVVTSSGPAIGSTRAADLEIAGNRLSQKEGSAQISSPFSGAATSLTDRRDVPALIVLDAGTRRCRVTGNLVGPGACHGIGLTLSTFWEVVIAGNELLGLGGSGIASINPLPGLPYNEIEIANTMLVDLQHSQSAVVKGAGSYGRFTPNRIDYLRIEGNTITGCCLGSGVPGGQADSPPLGGIVVSRLSHVQISGNHIEGNGQNQSGQNQEPVAGIFVDDCKGLIVRDNVVTGNGPEPDGQSIPGPQGGILATALTVAVSSVSRDTKAAIADGWPAASIQDNLVVAPRGLALVLTGMGPMQVTGNRLTARDLLAIPLNATPQIESFIGAVLITNLGMPGYLYPQIARLGFLTQTIEPLPLDTPAASEVWTVGGKVDFSHNQVSYDLTRDESQIAVAAVVILTLDDLGLHDNQTECRLLADTLVADTFALGVTVRAHGNGFTESLQSVLLSLWSYGLAMSTGVGNQGTHCILIQGYPTAQIRDDDNLEWHCLKPSGLSITQAQDAATTTATTTENS